MKNSKVNKNPPDILLALCPVKIHYLLKTM